MQIEKTTFDKTMKLLKEYGGKNTICTENSDVGLLRILALTDDNVSMIDILLNQIVDGYLPEKILIGDVKFKEIYNKFKSDKSDKINIELDGNSLNIFTDKTQFHQIVTDTNLLPYIPSSDTSTEIIINNDTVDTFKKECNMIKTLGGHTYLGIENGTLRYRMNTNDIEYKMDYDLSYCIHSNCNIVYDNIGEIKTDLSLTHKYLLKNVKKTVDTRIRITFGDNEWCSTPVFYNLLTDIGYIKYIQAPMMYD